MTADDQLMLETPWFKVVARNQPGREPYYLLDLPDYVAVVAVTAERRVLFVRQFRPVVQRYTIELPSGHVEPNESPEDAGRRELLEETGFVAQRLERLGTLVPDVGRLANRMWCYFAADVKPGAGIVDREEGISVIELTEKEALVRASDGTVDHALNLAA